MELATERARSVNLMATLYKALQDQINLTRELLELCSIGLQKLHSQLNSLWIRADEIMEIPSGNYR